MLEELCNVTGQHSMSQALLVCARNYPRMREQIRQDALALSALRRQYADLVELLQRRDELGDELANVTDLIHERINDSEDDCQASGVSG